MAQPEDTPARPGRRIARRSDRALAIGGRFVTRLRVARPTAARAPGEAGMGRPSVVALALESCGAPGQVDRPSHRVNGLLEERCLGPHEVGRLLERAGRLAERLGLLSQRGAALLEQIEYGVRGREGVTHHLTLEPALALEHLLDELRLVLQRREQLTWKLPPAGSRHGGREEGLHRRLPLADQIVATDLGHRTTVRDSASPLLVGNHSGGNVAPDTLVFATAFTRRFGTRGRSSSSPTSSSWPRRGSGSSGGTGR
jgi:hypothetical protein